MRRINARRTKKTEKGSKNIMFYAIYHEKVFSFSSKAFKGSYELLRIRRVFV